MDVKRRPVDAAASGDLIGNAYDNTSTANSIIGSNGLLL
jgi:hypothetical protein